MNRENFIGSPLSYPLSVAYRGVVKLRNSLYDRGVLPTSRGPLPTICVGNAIAGGSGKSPFVDFLGRELLARGYRPAMICRGYGGRLKGPCLVSDAHAVAEVGDEAVMHHAETDGAVPVVVARNRLEGVRFLREKNLADTAVLDDGYQHRRLERDLNLLLLDISNMASAEKWLNGRLLPAGYLREPLETAIARADCLVLIEKGNGTQPLEPALAPLNRYYDLVPQIRARISPSHFVDEVSRRRHPLGTFRQTKAAAAAAIAAPESFFAMLESDGVELVDRTSRSDHYDFTVSDWAACSDGGRRPVFTTSKDAAKLTRYANRPGQLFTLRLQIKLLGDEQPRQFWELVEAVLNPRRLNKAQGLR